MVAAKDAAFAAVGAAARCSDADRAVLVAEDGIEILTYCPRDLGSLTVPL